MIDIQNERERAESDSQCGVMGNLHCDAISKRKAGKEVSLSQRKEEFLRLT